MSMLLAPEQRGGEGRAEDGKEPAEAPQRRRRRRADDAAGEPASRAPATTSAIRSAAWPSQSGGGSGRLAARSASAAGMLGDRRRVEAEQRVGAGADRHRPLGVVAQGEAGDAEVGRLLLDAAGVGEHGAGVGDQREEVEVAERLGRAAGPGASALELASIILRVRGWTGKTTGISRGQRGAAAAIVSPSSGPSTRAGRCRVTSSVAAGLDARAAPPRPAARKRSSSATRVSIIVLPTKCMRSSAMPSARRFSTASSLCRKSSSEKLVGDDPVDLLGHRPVEAAQAGLDVGDRDPHLRRGQRRRQGRVDVAGDDDQVGPLVGEHRLEPLHHPRRLLRRGCPSRPRACGRARARRAPRRRPPTSAGRSAGRCGRSVWRPSGRRAPQRADHRRRLDEVRPRPDHVEDAHRGASSTCAAGPSRRRLLQ